MPVLDPAQAHRLLALFAVAAYFVGAVPFGLLAGKAQGVDIRLSGSKNIGASNAGRVLGRKWFWIVFMLDLLKGLVPMIAASVVANRLPAIDQNRLTYLLWIGVGVAAIVGHVFPIYLKFRGGKGVATSAGVILGLWPYFTFAGLVAVLTFVVVVMAWRYISLASISAAFVFPAAYVAIGRWRGWDVFGDQLPLCILACAIAGLVIWRHRDNVRRLRAGTENKIRTARS